MNGCQRRRTYTIDLMVTGLNLDTQPTNMHERNRKTMAADRLILVVGATGTQGGAVLDALLQQGKKVRALCRSTSKGEALAARGVDIVVGSFDDYDSLVKAAKGTSGVFSIQMPPSPSDNDSEVHTGRNLVEACKEAGVEAFVHTSVARAGDEESYVGWEEGR